MILITGASSGIGEACAHAFAVQGRDLILVARRQDRLEKLAIDLRSNHSIQVEVFALDVTRLDQVKAFAAACTDLLNRVTILVNNAGLAKGFDLIQDGRIDEWEQMIDTNLKGLLYVSRTVLPFLLQRPQSHIVNIGSVAGHWTYPKGNVYCATKAAVKALTEAMRLDLNGTRVRVTEISPGMVETEFSQVRLGDDVKAKAVYQGLQPLTPSDVAEAVAWCVGRPSHVNIQEVVIYPTAQASPSLVSRSILT